MTRQEAPFRGTIEECVKHFSIKHEKLLVADRCRTRRKICELIGVDRTTGQRWFTQGNMPKGIYLFKLCILLELSGYIVDQREGLIDIQRDLADQLAFGLYTSKGAAVANSVTDNTILRWAGGWEKPLGQHKENEVAQFLKLHAEKAQAEKNRWRDQLRSLHVISQEVPRGDAQEVVSRQEPVSSAPASLSAPTRKGGSGGEQMIETLAYLILAMKPLAKRATSDEFTREDREKLRQLTANGHSNAVFEVSNLLNRLCSERARVEIPQTTEKGA